MQVMQLTMILSQIAGTAMATATAMATVTMEMPTTAIAALAEIPTATAEIPTIIAVILAGTAVMVVVMEAVPVEMPLQAPGPRIWGLAGEPGLFLVWPQCRQTQASH